jgi:hypothetical protein
MLDGYSTAGGQMGVCQAVKGYEGHAVLSISYVRMSEHHQHLHIYMIYLIYMASKG